MTTCLPSAPGGRVNAVRALPGYALREVQAILRLWSTIKHELHEGEADALYGGYGSGNSGNVGRSNRPSNPTQSRAIRLASDGRLQSFRRLDNALERALALAGNRQAPIVRAMRQHYLRNRGWGEIAEELCVSRATTVVWQRRFRVLVWEQLRGRR